MSKFYITTAIAYTNAAPHMGHALEFILTDTIARYHRLKGDQVHFLTGTDEHGSKIYQVAKKADVPVQEFVDANTQKFIDLKKTLELSWDDFIRTSDPEKKHDHFAACQKLWKKLEANDDFEKRQYSGYYCTGCESFITEKELVNGLCVIHQKPAEYLEEKNWFFKLSKYTNRIIEIIKNKEVEIVPEFRANEILEMLKKPTDISFSRPEKILPWGVPVPAHEHDKKDPQTMYVWCDALTNYISAIGYADPNFEIIQQANQPNQSARKPENQKTSLPAFWPCDVHVIGKDILRFHAGIWLGMLLSAKLPLPKKILVHGFLASEGQKMSKSLGNVVDPIDIVNEYSADALRYYLLSQVPVGYDGDFSLQRFKEIYNSNLANNLGNLLNRVITLALKLESRIENRELRIENQKLINQAWEKYHEAFKTFAIQEATKVIQDLAAYGNKLVDETKLWELVKNDPAKAQEIITELLEILKQIMLMLTPLLPETASKMCEILGLEFENKNFQSLATEIVKIEKLKKGIILFPRKN